MKSKVWYGIYGNEYIGEEPAFFDTKNFEWNKVLTESFPEIKRILAPLMEEKNTDLKPYFDTNIQFPPKNWKTIGFYFWGKKNYDNCERFPEIVQILDKIPNLVTASFNMLEPHSVIKPHFGDTNAVYRCHLGISIPAGLPLCGFKVKEETKAWVEGETIVFLDANIHEAFNNTSQRRYILLLDIMRPEFIKYERRVCLQVLSMLTLYYVIPFIEKIKGFGINVPEWVINLGLFIVKIPLSVYLPIQRKLNIKKIVKSILLQT